MVIHSTDPVLSPDAGACFPSAKNGTKARRRHVGEKPGGAVSSTPSSKTFSVPGQAMEPPGNSNK
ncbi:MAG: hypothetical protein NVSMB43_27400 [Pseudarthrobacter sp.]